MKDKKFLLVDIDGVVLDWIGGIIAHLDRQGIETTTKYPRRWKLDHWIEGHDYMKLLREFNDSEHFERLECLDDSLKYLKKLNAEFEIVAITSCGSGTIKERRIKNLREIFGDDFFFDVHVLDLHESKAEYLERYPKGIWIEDNFENALLGLEFGHTTLIYAQPYNIGLNHPKIRRVGSWKEIFEHLSCLYR